MERAHSIRQVAAGLAVGFVVASGALAMAVPAGAATSRAAGCDYYADDCGSGGGGGGGGIDYPTIPTPSVPTSTPMIDPGLIGLAAATLGGGAGGVVLRKRARRA